MVENKKEKVKKEVAKVKPVKMDAENYDASGLVLGRFASFIAQKLMKGEVINVYNAEKVIITGDPKLIVSEYSERYQYRAKGNPRNGPKYPKLPHLVLKKTITKMLPPSGRGVEASKRLLVYVGNEDNKKLLTVDTAKVKQGLKYIELDDLCKKLGAKW